MTDDLITEFLGAPTATRLALVRSGEHDDVWRRLLGDAAFAEYKALASRRSSSAHLGADAPRNTVFVPGVMGSMLVSRGLGGFWWVDVRTRGHLNDLRLSPDGQRDARPEHDVVAMTTDPLYEPFLAALLDRDDFGHVIFPYDWRKPLAASARAFADLVLRLSADLNGDPVHIVAHSMGGLVVRTALARYYDELKNALGRIVFVGTPHYGSPAIGGYLKNHLWGFEMMAVLGTYLSRETFQSLWGVLELLPAPSGIYPGTRPKDAVRWSADGQYAHPCANFDLYDATAWGLFNNDAAGTARLQRVLDGAAGAHRALFDAHTTLPQEMRDRMLVIAGVGVKTLFRLAYHPRFWGQWDHMERTTSRVAGDPHRDGDGRVPLASAALENVAIRYVRGVHGGLTNIPAVYNDVFRWLADEPLELPDTPEGALSVHLAADDVSETPTLDGSNRASGSGDDPGYWNDAAAAPATLTSLDAMLDADALPEFSRVRLL